MNLKAIRSAGVLLGAMWMLCAQSTAQSIDVRGAAERPTIYRLTRAAQFQEGCFDPCDCLLRVEDNVRGVMILGPAQRDEGELVRSVRQVNWYVGSDEGERQYYGRGEYRVRGRGDQQMQRLTLFLSLDGAEARRFDSGWVAGGSQVPATLTGLTVSRNDQVCFDTVFVVEAEAAEARCFRLDGESTYQEGCLPPCLCPILATTPLAGRYLLVEIQDFGTYMELAVVDASFRVVSDFEPPSATFRGFGRYTLISGFAGWLQQLELDLSIDGGPPVDFDSGLKNIGTPPEVPPFDIAVARNGFYCYDIVLNISVASCGSALDDAARSVSKP